MAVVASHSIFALLQKNGLYASPVNFKIESGDRLARGLLRNGLSSGVCNPYSNESQQKIERNHERFWHENRIAFALPCRWNCASVAVDQQPKRSRNRGRLRMRLLRRGLRRRSKVGGVYE